MSFFNPFSLILMMTIHSLNLLQMDANLAKDLSGTYAVVKSNESISTGQCPDAFNIEVISGSSPHHFFFKNQVKFQGMKTSLPRVLPIDGQSRRLFGGQVVKGEVTKPNAIEVAVFNPNDPNEFITETFEFTKDGDLLYKTDHKASSRRKVAFFNTLCAEMIYRKI